MSETSRLLNFPVVTNPNLPKDSVYIMHGDLLQLLGGIPPKDYRLRARLKRAWRELREEATDE
jgi:hypothetical protein